MSQEPIGFIQDGEEAGSIQEKLNNSILESNNYRKHKDGTEEGFSHQAEKIKYDDVDVEGVPTPRNVKEAIEQINLATKTELTETAETIKTKYESNADTNAFTDAEKTKLSVLDSSKWEPETISVATEVHPRWNDSGNVNIYGLDTFGFNALPGSTRFKSGNFTNIGRVFGMWCSNYPWAVEMYESMSDVTLFQPISGQEKIGYAVRLVRSYVIGDGEKTDGRILVGAFTDFDGNVYDGTIIGDQVWATSNLRTTSYLNGDTIPTGVNDTDWSNLTSGAYAVYDHTLVDGINSEQEMVDAYGILYNWYVVDDVRGLSSEGHVPTDAEFTQLTDYLIATYSEITSANIGNHLKSIRQVNSPYVIGSDTLIRPKDGKKVDASHIEGLEQGGHTILDPSENTMPTRPALQFGAGFTVTDEVGKTVVERGIIDYADIIPDPTKGKKLAKVKDDGTGLDYTNYGYDEVVQKAQTFNAGTLKKFDVNGNDVDSGLTGESLDIYAISPSLINALTNESNWRDGAGNQIAGEVIFASGIQGQRYYSNEFFYECIADSNWVRTYTGRPVINIYDNPTLTLVFKGYLEDTSNWVGKIYVGAAITGVAQGTRHYDNDYVYEFFQTNVPIRYSRD